jgi:septal ring factor EnvC (AmiA/AmiB activator)
LKNARTNLSEVKQDTLTAYQEFVKKSEAQLKEYDKYIADLKTKIVKEKKKDKALYEKKLAKLEQKNKELKTKLVNYKNEKVSDWKEMSVEFKKDLDELGNAITGFFGKE